ncbi:retrovirus-related pol polyprotein from transposon TNT 1-94 [Tanacetum coccineum]
MSNMSKDIQYAGSDTRSPMLNKTDFESWQQRIRLYCLGKDNGENIMKSITEGPFQMGTVSDIIAAGTEGAFQQGPVRARVFTDLSAEEKERLKADIRATNILFQGIPKDIYSLINHYIDAKDICYNVKMILEGSELTKDDRESQIYDEFEHFCQIKGETIQVYYVRFTKLINDMRNIKMTMLRMQLNFKFVNNMLPEWSRFITEVKLNRGLKESNFDQLYAYLKQHEVHANENRMMMERFIQPTNDPLALVSNASAQSARNNARGGGGTGNVGGQNRVGNMNPGQAKPIVCYNCKGIRHITRECPQPKRPQDSDYYKDKMLLMNAHENGAVLDEEQLLFLAGEQATNFDDDMDDLALNVDHVFEANQCDAFDSDVDEAPTTQTMFMANLTSKEAGPSYDSNIPSEVQDREYYSDCEDEYHEVHEMQSDVQHNYIVDSHADYTSDSNIIPYDQYVEDNEENVVQSNVSSIQNDALMSILDEMHEDNVQQGVQRRLANKPNIVVNDSLNSELARYKELVGMYERRAKFKLTDRERNIDAQMRIIISNRNRKETSLNSKLHSLQMQLCSTLNHHKTLREEAIILKKDFKQKEYKFLEEFLDIKKLKEKVEDRLYKQDQSVQTVHMLCKLKSFYDEKNKVAIGYKNPLCLTRARQVQSALYNGNEIFMTNHAPAVVHDSEDTLEIAKITRKRMLTKMKSPLCVENKIRITPTCVTKWERGFEQTKRCYLTEVIPFFKTLKEHFAGVQTALFKEVKVMEEIFDQMNNKVDQNGVDKQCAEIVKKNLLIENENLIANCLSNQLLYDVEKSRCLDLEAEMSNVQNESKHISKLEREYLNLQLKYQHLQESFDNDKSQTSQEVPDFNSFFKIKNLEHQIQEKDNVIRDWKVLVSNVNARNYEPYKAKDVTDLLEQNERLRAENNKVKQHYKELFESIKITRAGTNE